MAGLSARLVALVRDLQQEQQQALTVERVTAEAVAWAGADAVASISIVRRRAKRIETIGATSETVIRGDALQYELGQGPCLAAIWDQVQVYSADLASDERWPAWAPRVAQELDVHSLLSTRLFTAMTPWAPSTSTPRTAMPSTRRPGRRSGRLPHTPPSRWHTPNTSSS